LTHLVFVIMGMQRTKTCTVQNVWALEAKVLHQEIISTVFHKLHPFSAMQISKQTPDGPGLRAFAAGEEIEM
jgi:hypothetical protein